MSSFPYVPHSNESHLLCNLVLILSSSLHVFTNCQPPSATWPFILFYLFSIRQITFFPCFDPLAVGTKKNPLPVKAEKSCKTTAVAPTSLVPSKLCLVPRKSCNPNTTSSLATVRPPTPLIVNPKNQCGTLLITTLLKVRVPWQQRARIHLNKMQTPRTLPDFQDNLNVAILTIKNPTVPTKMVWPTRKLWKLVHKQVERVHVFLEIKWFPHPFPHLFDLFSINAFITTLALEWNTYFTSINVMCQIILFSISSSALFIQNIFIIYLLHTTFRSL